MEITGTNPSREIKVEKARRIKRTGREKQGKQDKKRAFSDLLGQDMDQVELHGLSDDPASDDPLVSTDIVSISTPGLADPETKLASDDIVDLEHTQELAEESKPSLPKKQMEPVDPEQQDSPSVDTLA